MKIFQRSLLFAPASSRTPVFARKRVQKYNNPYQRTKLFGIFFEKKRFCQFLGLFLKLYFAKFGFPTPLSRPERLLGTLKFRGRRDAIIYIRVRAHARARGKPEKFVCAFSNFVCAQAKFGRCGRREQFVGV